MLYQTLVGAWPDGMGIGDDDLSALGRLAERVIEWQRKALREAKRRSDWVAPSATQKPPASASPAPCYAT
jgi:(1->4)-alpha-D-glucan 1-alpha-D-glucosylmutase